MNYTYNLEHIYALEMTAVSFDTNARFYSGLCMQIEWNISHLNKGKVCDFLITLFIKTCWYSSRTTDENDPSNLRTCTHRYSQVTQFSYSFRTQASGKWQLEIWKENNYTEKQLYSNSILLIAVAVVFHRITVPGFDVKLYKISLYWKTLKIGIFFNEKKKIARSNAHFL